MIQCRYKVSDYMKKILLVEDDITIHNLIKELLLNEGYLVIDAYSGTEALILLERESVSLILLDLMLPGINGEEIIKDLFLLHNTGILNADREANCECSLYKSVKMR